MPLRGACFATSLSGAARSEELFSQLRSLDCQSLSQLDGVHSRSRGSGRRSLGVWHATRCCRVGALCCVACYASVFVLVHRLLLLCVRALIALQIKAPLRIQPRFRLAALTLFERFITLRAEARRARSAGHFGDSDSVSTVRRCRHRLRACSPVWRGASSASQWASARGFAFLGGCWLSGFGGALLVVRVLFCGGTVSPPPRRHFRVLRRLLRSRLLGLRWIRRLRLLASLPGLRPMPRIPEWLGRVVGLALAPRRRLRCPRCVAESACRLVSGWCPLAPVVRCADLVLGVRGGAAHEDCLRS